MVLNDKYAFYFCLYENTLFLLAKMTQDTGSLLSVTVQKWCIYFYFKISSFQEGNYICNGNNLIFVMMCYNLTIFNTLWCLISMFWYFVVYGFWFSYC